MKPPVRFHADPDKCVRCGLCVEDCIVSVLQRGPDKLPYLPPENEPYCLRCQHCLSICPTGAVSICGVKADDVRKSESAPLPDPERMENLIRRRRSVRRYEPENLPRETLDKLRKILDWTPTGCNAHKLFFTIVEDRAQMEIFRKPTLGVLKFLIRTGILGLLHPGFRRYMTEIVNGRDVIYRDAPHMIAVSYHKSAPCGKDDAVIALTQFDLYAQSLNVGTCWCGFALFAFRHLFFLRSKLQLPPGYRPGAVLLFGRSAVRYPRDTKPAPFPAAVLPDQKGSVSK